MLPPVFPVLNIPEIQAHVGSSPARIFDFQDVPQDCTKPYIAFTQVANSPFDGLKGAPCADLDVIQIDVYALDKAQCRAIAKLVRAALYAQDICNQMTLQQKEVDTNLYRISIDADFIA